MPASMKMTSSRSLVAQVYPAQPPYTKSVTHNVHPRAATVVSGDVNKSKPSKRVAWRMAIPLVRPSDSLTFPYSTVSSVRVRFSITPPAPTLSHCYTVHCRTGILEEHAASAICVQTTFQEKIVANTDCYSSPPKQVMYV